MNDVFTNPADLTAAVVAKAKGYDEVVMVPTMGDQLLELIKPGRAVAFRTESGSLYEINMYSTTEVRLIKVDEETDGIREVAAGKLVGAHDRERGVYGLVVEEESGRQYKTSAVVKAWLSYDAVAGDSYTEPN